MVWRIVQTLRSASEFFVVYPRVHLTWRREWSPACYLWYPIECIGIFWRLWIWEKYSSVHCLMVLFIIVIVRQTIPLHQGIASYYQIYQVPDMQPIIWAGFKIVSQSNNQEPAVFVEGKGSVLHHSVGALLAQKEYQDHRQQPRRSHQCEQLCSGRGEEGMMLVDIQWRLLYGLHLVPGGCAKAGGS